VGARLLGDICSRHVTVSFSNFTRKEQLSYSTIKMFNLGRVIRVVAKLPNNVQKSRSKKKKKKLHHCKSEASVSNGSYNQGSYYRNAESAAALVHPLTVQAVEVLHVQLHF